MSKFDTPQEALRHHVTGAIERGEKEPITARPMAVIDITVKNGIVEHVAVPEGFAITIVVHDWGDINDDSQAVHTSVWP
jgi:hypothetical protein